MSALRIGFIIPVALLIAGVASLAIWRTGLIGSPTEHVARMTTPRDFQPVTSDAMPCGRRAGPETETSALTSRFLKGVATAPDRNQKAMPIVLQASDLPGIVKLEPELDVSDSEIAKGHCSATRIAGDWFVTAAHCVSEGYDRILLKAGSEDLHSDTIRSVNVDYAVCHSGFGHARDQFDNDIALLKISDDSLPLISDVPTIQWGRTSDPFSTIRYRSARVGGWGLKTYGGELNDHLQKMELDIMQIEPHLIRLASRAGRGPCIGDSGGPLVVEDHGEPVLMGVLSTVASNRNGEMCSGSYTSSYTNLASYRNWALDTMKRCEADDQACKQS